LAADDFNWLSTTSAGGSDAYASAAHVVSGSQDGGCPAWINPTTTSILNNFDDGNPNLGVPDASVTIALLGASLAGIEAFRRKLQSRCAR
jgi:hypothetical protein